MKSVLEELRPTQNLWSHDDDALPELFGIHIERLRLLIWDAKLAGLNPPRNGGFGPAFSDAISNSTSCRYGVTYSVSDITGLGDSGFIVC